jgi:hypothetical protein
MKVHLQPQKDYWGMKGNLSDRVRPNVEAAPWVIEEIKKLEAMLKEPTKLMLIPELMKQAGWRRCAEGQKTTQYCGMAEQARLEEREACAIAAKEFADYLGEVGVKRWKCLSCEKRWSVK